MEETRTTRKMKVAAAVAVAALVGVTLGVATAVFDLREGGRGGGSIEVSYAFDVRDKRELMRHANEVFVADVVAKEKTDDAAGTTVWRVSIAESVKGTRSGTVLVRQLGYVDREGLPHETEEQAALKIGKRYLLVTSRDPGAAENTLIVGPASSVETRSPEQQQASVREYREAMR